jgi:hypothetical protein
MKRNGTPVENDPARPSDGFHNNGFIRDKGEGRGVRVTRPKANEAAVIMDEVSAVQRVAGPKPNIRKTKLAVMGIPSSVLEYGSPEYARCIRLANQFRKVRSREIYEAHGHVSSGCSALLATAALALAASRFLFEIASTAEVLPEKGLGVPQLLKMAASLGDSYRQNELSAWELAAREGVIHRRNADAAKGNPWLVSDSSGTEKRKPGRPRKVQLVEQEAENKELSQGQGLEIEALPSEREEENG